MRVKIVDYFSNEKPSRNKIFLPENIVSLVLQGEKAVYYAGHKTLISSKQFALLSSGNCLMSEKKPLNDTYRSMMLFFDNDVLTQFFVKYASIINSVSKKNKSNFQPFIVFEKDDFILNYIASLEMMASQSAQYNGIMSELKFEELMLYLLEKYPMEICSFKKNQEKNSDLEIKKAVELNITNALSLDELAFLCHMSVSTFKRKFLKIYNASPTQYFLSERMKIAKNLLLQNENPSEIYHKIGYQNHSSFSQAFKQIYGVSPTLFRQQKSE